MSDQPIYFAQLGAPGRIWAISAINGHAGRLNLLHNEIWRHFKPGDKIIYLGNYLGEHFSSENPDTIDHITLFKDALVAQNLATPQDIVCLKGSREHMWQKLLHLQFADRPIDVLTWMLRHGMEGQLNHYGSTGADGLSAARSGVIALTRWTSDLRHALRAKTGHDDFYKDLKRAAYTAYDRPGQDYLFVHAGLDPQRPLQSQNDSFWWNGNAFDTLNHPYGNYLYVIRGADPLNRGTIKTRATVTLDGRHDQGGLLVCGRFSEYSGLSELYYK